jgi:Tol biopolymer transport system component/predicted Ser/Thr protein kinase
MIGQTISHYRILEKLGEGGMGVVYKAHDTKLDRDVALKFLPHYLTSDPIEKERFYHEARAAAALTHQNIAVIHEIGEHENQLFIAMEFVEGKTLKRLMESETLSVKRVLDIAIQVCEGLAAAHEKGIVHRDIKSDNIIVTAKGQAKIMDFGLAKVKGATKLTKTGSTLGTAAYMSPEQALGEEVDHRSDIFSFGVVLYELLTSRLPFKAEHEAALMYAIVNEEPQPIARFNEKVTPELEHVVMKALAKDKEERYQHADDLLADLRHERKGLEYSRAGYVRALSVEQPVAEREPAKAKRNLLKYVIPITIVVAAAVLLVILVLYFGVFRTRTAELNPGMIFQTLQISFSQISYPGISADGNWIAFPAADASGKWDIYYMNATVGEPRRVTFDSIASSYGSGSTAGISPDGGLIAYDRYDAKRGGYDVYIVPSIGGRSKRIAEDCQDPKWRRDGGRIGYTVSTRKEFSVWSVKLDGSERRREILDTLTGIVERFDFDWLPDGRSIVWLRSFPGGYQEIIRRDLETGKETQLTYDKRNIDEVCWASNDQIIYSSNKSGNTNLWMIPASGGQSVQITKGSGPDMGMSISADGKKLLYLQSQTAGHLWMGGIASHVTRQLTTDERNITWPAISPDGNQIAFGMSDNDPLKSTSHIFVCDRDGSNRRQITGGDEFAEWPSWSPNGKWISYYAMKGWQSSDSAMIYIVDQADPGSPRPLGRGRYSKWIDTTTILITNPGRGIGSIVILDGKSTSITHRDSVTLWPILDGKNVLLRDYHNGKEGWYIAAARNNQIIEEAKPRKLLTRPHPPNLSPDKRFFYYSVGNDILRRISLPEGKDEQIPGTFPGLSFLFSISSDGKEIVYNDSHLNAKLVIIENPFR